MRLEFPLFFSLVGYKLAYLVLFKIFACIEVVLNGYKKRNDIMCITLKDAKGNNT